MKVKNKAITKAKRASKRKLKKMAEELILRLSSLVVDKYFKDRK